MLQIDLGDAFRNMKQYDSARVTFERLRSAQPEGDLRSFVDYKIVVTEAMRLDAAGNTGEAKKLYDTIVSKYPDVVNTGLAAEFPEIVRRQAELSGAAPNDTALR